MICAGCVFRCFKTLERWGNYVTGAAGPYFVGLAAILIGMGIVCFCKLSRYPLLHPSLRTLFYFILTPVDVIAPSLPFPILTIPICVLIVLNLVFHYFYCVTVRPGFVDSDGEAPMFALRELGTVDSIFWAKRKGGRKGKVRAPRSPRMTPAELTRCTKCNRQRPEVSHFLVDFTSTANIMVH